MTVWRLACILDGLPNNATIGYNVYTPTSRKAPAVPGLNEVATSPLFKASYFVEYWQKYELYWRTGAISAIRSAAARKFGFNVETIASIRRQPEALAACIISLPSAALIANGFSQSTCFPALSALRVYSQWV